MLYLITGVPGSGKTLKMMSDLMNRPDLKNRPLYLDGIPEVKGDIIPNQPIPEGESMQTWHKWAPPGAILVIDECQRVFRPRPSGSKVPDYVAELETQRHRGIDIFLLTQHPRLIDVNVRSLIGHHVHIGKTSMGVRRMVEWERCANPEANVDIANGVKSVYTLDKKAFGVYKSAEEHTKIKTKRSKILYIFPMAIVAIIIGMWYVYSSWQQLSKPIEVPQEVQASQQQTANMNAAASEANTGGQYAQTPPPPPQRPHLSEEDYVPRIDGMPHTAPIYDAMNKAVKTMPYPVACVKNANKCTCYTEQATPVKVNKQQCLDFVKNGIYNPYKERQAVTEAVQTASPAADMPPATQVAVMGGKSKASLMYDGYVEARTDMQ